MAEGQRMTAAQVVDKLMTSEHTDVLRESVAWLVAELIEAEVTEQIGAAHGERAPERRTTQRNGYRPRQWDTRVGTIELAIPKLRQGSFMPSILEPRRRAEQALVAVVQETGRREVLGLEVGEGETESFWREFLRSLRARGLSGIRLCVSDAHEGLKNAIAQVLGAPWQRCCVHFQRDMLGHVAKAHQPLVSGAIRGIFTATSGDEARERLAAVVDQLQAVAPKVARLLEDAEPDLLAFYAFPAEHWSKLRSTNPLERVNREIGRRSDVVGIFPNDAALIRLAGALLIEQNDEWLVGRRYLSESSMNLVVAQTEDNERENIDHQEEVPQLQAA